MLSKIRLALNTKTLFVVLVIFVFLLTNRHQWASDIRNSADDTTYLSYAMSMGMDLDLDFTNELSIEGNRGPNRVSPKGFYGAGLMAAPFVGFFSLFDRVVGNPVIEDRTRFLHSWSYFGFSFAVHFYFLFSILLLWKCARFFNERPSRLLILLLTVSSGVLYFVLTRPRMGHAFEFFALSLITYAGVRLWGAFKAGRLGASWALAAALGVNLCVAVRMNDANVVLLPILVFLLFLCLERGGVVDSGKGGLVLRSLSAYLIFVAAIYVPFGLLNNVVYDEFFPSRGDIYGATEVMPALQGFEGYLARMENLLALLPKTWIVFFGAEFGLLYSNPVVVFGLFFIVLMLLGKAVRGRPLVSLITLSGVACYVLFSLSFVLLWQSTASSYGYRYLYPLFPLAFIGYLLWWGGSTGVSRRLIHCAFLVLCVFSVLGQAFFTKSEKLSYHTGMTSLGRVAAAAPDFNKNLATEIFTMKVWNKALKDGVFGFVNKMYISKSSLKWRADQTFFAGKYNVPEPNWQHPPVVGLFMLILAVMWFMFFRYGVRRAD